MNTATTQTLENMPGEPSPSSLTRLASEDYIRNLPNGFWSPVYTQEEDQTEAYEFNFNSWQEHYNARKAAMRQFIEDWLKQDGTILESFSDDRPTADFTEAYRNGCTDVLWNLKGTRRLDLHGTITQYDQPFLPTYMTPQFLAEHLTNRMFAFNMRVATWLESRQTTH